jgi:hypothetical protein
LLRERDFMFLGKYLSNDCQILREYEDESTPE